jgi:vacuolar-type H+-ATPase subunit D/Vma8
LVFHIFQAALKKKLKTIEAEMKQAESEKESRVKDAAKAVDAAKKAVAKAKVDLNKATQAVEAKRLELEALNVGGRVVSRFALRV